MYIFLLGGRVNKHRKRLNILIVFLVSGLWHGGAWTFIVWGLLNGVLRVLEETKVYVKICEIIEKMHLSFIKVPITFLIVNYLWVFFRANSFFQAKYIIRRTLSVWNIKSIVEQVSSIIFQSFGNSYFIMIIILTSIIIGIVMLIIEDGFENNKETFFEIESVIGKYSLAVMLLLSIIISFSIQHGMADWNAGFIYFQF